MALHVTSSAATHAADRLPVEPDWQAPWHAPLQPLAPAVWQAWQAGPCELRSRSEGHPEGACAAALGAFPCAAPVQFVPQHRLPDGMAYEQFIHDTRQVPTRDNLHDFYNGLMWLHFPRTKLRLNALQAAELARMGGVQATRGPVRDALTLFDENVALLQAPDALWDALAWKRWPDLFGAAMRPLWQSARLVLFGHALLEQLVHPYKALTAHVYPVPASLCAPDATDWRARWDAWLASTLTAERLADKPFAHLPVLGVPGWWTAADTEPAFRADPAVFRPLRRPPPAALLALLRNTPA